MKTNQHVKKLKNKTKTLICANENCKKEFIEKFYSSSKYCPECKKFFIPKKIVKCYYCDNQVEVPANFGNNQLCDSCKSQGKSLPKKSKKIICIYCNKEFESYYNARKDTPCPECKEKGYISKIASETGKMGTEKFKEDHNGLAPSQVKEIKIKLSNTLTEKFKNEDYKNKIIEKRKKTLLEKTGYEHQMHNPEVKEKLDNTMIERYGVKRVLQREDYINNLKKICMEKRSDDRKELLNQLNIIIYNNEHKLCGDEHEWKCLECNKIFKTSWNNIKAGYLCPNCYPRTRGTSLSEKNLFKLISNLLPNEDVYNGNKKAIHPFELDIYIPNKNIAFEYDSFWYHSEQYGYANKFYHINKTKLCKEKGIRLIHIFEDEWIFKRKIVEEKIKQILNISICKNIDYKDCIIKEINNDTKNNFLNEYHLINFDNSTLSLGVFYNNQLISIMTFIQENNSNNWIINNFCINYNYSIIGIEEKIITYFKQNYNWNEIFIYIDLRWNTGELYYKMGFRLIDVVGPNKWNIKNSKRIIDPNDISDLENYLTIYDCGSLKFSMKNI